MSFFGGLPGGPAAYIGVSAVDEASVRPLAELAISMRLDKQASPDVVLGAGFLLTHESVDAADPPTSRQVTSRQLGNILRNHGLALFTIAHYVPKSQASLIEELDRMARHWVDGPDAIQINADSGGSVPEADQLRRVRERYSLGDRIILSVPRSVIASGNAGRVLDYVGMHRGAIGAVLLDPSEGAGLDIDLDLARSLVHEIRSAFPELSVGLAGGFTPENVAGRLVDLRESAPFNIDAQSGLRDKASNEFSLKLAIAYVSNASAVLRSLSAR